MTAKREGLKASDGHFQFSAFLKAMWLAKWAILVPVIILGGIYSGMFTPTEAGAVCCIYAVIIALFVDRTLDLKGILECASESAVTGATIFISSGCCRCFWKSDDAGCRFRNSCLQEFLQLLTVNLWYCFLLIYSFLL